MIPRRQTLQVYSNNLIISVTAAVFAETHKLRYGRNRPLELPRSAQCAEQ
jgi:hypothetical protein